MVLDVGLFSGSHRDDDEDDDDAAVGQLCLACLIQILHKSMCRLLISKRCMHMSRAQQPELHV